MKPITLIMSGFGSYGGVEEIDFQQVNQGIFLITGDTGAGKTTIFDAITYALFDETSGGRRDGEMMRSQYAKENVATFVELTFSYSGEIYKIKRNPNYLRVSKRRNKEGELTHTTEAASVELTMPDGKVFLGKTKETNEKIREILGVDVNQFTQISMIAQGEFLKLLHAPSKERKEIFSRIFDTKIYWQIQNHLREESKGLYISLNDNLNLIRHELEGIWIPEDQPERKQQWEDTLGHAETGKEEIFRELVSLGEYLKHQQGTMEQQEGKMNQTLDEVKLSMARARELNQEFDRMNQAQESIAELTQQQGELLEKLAERNRQKQQLDKEREERLPKLEQQLAEARNLLPKYEVFSQQQSRCVQLEKEKQQAQVALEETEKKDQLQKKKMQELQESQKKLQPGLEELPKAVTWETELAGKHQELLDLCAQQEKLTALEKKQEAAREKVAFALTEFEEKNQEYQRCNHIFIQEQAGLLASDLKEGEPCPVCGSPHHPNKAALSQQAVTQGMVEEAKQCQEQAQERLEALRQEFQNQNQVFQGETQVFSHTMQRLFGERAAEVVLSEALKQCKQQWQQAKETCTQLTRQQKQYQNQAQELEVLLNGQTETAAEKEQLREQLYQAQVAYETATQSLKELRETLTYESQEALAKEIEILHQEKQQLGERNQQLQEIIGLLKQQQAKGEGTLEEQKKQLELWKTNLEGKERVDISLLEQRQQGILEEKQRLEEAKLTLISGKNRNLQAEEMLKKLYLSREALNQKYQIAETLSRTANGNLRQQARVDLQTYVQRRYFKYIISEANTRLVKISSGRFILQCRELNQLGKQGEAGLDLDVYDMVTDKVRDVKTLSGGESFLAALSMALGMADVIQKNVGKIHLDTMFIDEGFGSLDDEARGKAIQILQELAGDTRLVGIISHVTELKEQLDRKLIISKSDQGSHAAWQIEG